MEHDLFYFSVCSFHLASALKYLIYSDRLKLAKRACKLQRKCVHGTSQGVGKWKEVLQDGGKQVKAG